MKKINYLLLLLVSVFAFACSDDDNDDTPISGNDLPQTAQAFLAQYYPGVKVNRASTDTDDGRTEYDVYLANGHEVTFDFAGIWLDVDAPAGQTIPDGIAPAGIVDYLHQNYFGCGINEISKEPYGYDVELTNGTDLEFNSNGDFLRRS